MTLVYLVRHGVTEYNVHGQFQGSQDVPLDALGRRQAQRLGERFAEVDVDSVYSSPLIRAVQTAQPIADVHGLPVIEEPRFREIYAGVFEGRRSTVNKREYPEEFGNMEFSPGRFCPPGGETFAHLYSRVCEGMRELLEREDGRSAVIVTHYFPSAAITNFALGSSLEEVRPITTLNASVTLFEFDGLRCLRTVYTGDTSHLLLPDGTDLSYGVGAAFAKS